MNVRLLTIVLVLMSCLTACKKEYSGSIEKDSANSGKIIGPININGKREYEAQCASCHGADGNGTPSGSSLVGCATCTTQSVLADEITRTMPIGRVKACIDQCASDTAEYILQVFNNRITGSATSLQGVTSAPLTITLRRAALQLAGRMPTQSEVELVQNNGQEGLSKALDTLMNDPGFYENLMEVFNEQLLTDKYLSRNQFEGGVNLLDRRDHPKRKWYNDTYPGQEKNKIRACARTLTNDAVAREPLELIRYAAMNSKPHTLMLTADYIMVNWYSQQVYEAELLDKNTDFRKLGQPACDANGVQLYYDPSDFKPARISKKLEHSQGQLPHAGILTSAMFLNRYPTTFTNRNRHRSRIVFDYFLDTDILKITGKRPGDGIGNEKPNPTLLDPACYACHQVMDPVAAAFQHWTDRGQYIVTGSTSRNRWDGSDMERAGFAGKALPLSGETEGYFLKMLQWLGREISQDPRFIRATVRTVYKGLMAREPLSSPGEASSDAEKKAFNDQRAILNTIGQNMVADNWNIKTAFKGIIMSPYYQAAAVDDSTQPSHTHIGSSQFLSPEQLQRKLQATLGFGWDDLRWKDNKLMLGGMDSDSITKRIREPSGLMIAMQNRMATEMACRSVAYDFLKTQPERLLFPYVSVDTLPFTRDGNAIDSNIEQIKKNIKYLHWRLAGEELSVSDPEITATYQLFADVLKQGQSLLKNRQQYTPQPSSYLRWGCRGRWQRNENGSRGKELPKDQRLEQDRDYNLRAWMAVIAYLLADYRFIYE